MIIASVYPRAEIALTGRCVGAVRIAIGAKVGAEQSRDTISHHNNESGICGCFPVGRQAMESSLRRVVSVLFGTLSVCLLWKCEFLISRKSLLKRREGCYWVEELENDI